MLTAEQIAWLQRNKAMSSASGATSAAPLAAGNAASGALSPSRNPVVGAVKPIVQPGNAMLPDCRPVKGAVPGPAEHLLCATHGHVLDIKEKKIIAISLEQYKSQKMGSAKPAQAAPSAQEAPPAGPPTATAAPAQASSTGTASTDAAKVQAEAKQILNLMQLEAADIQSVRAEHEELAGGSRLNRTISWISDKFGGADDPGDELAEIAGQIMMEQINGIAAVGKQDLEAARKHLATMKALNQKAHVLWQNYTKDTSKGADRTVTGLTVVSKAGDVATMGLSVVAPGVGTALSVAKNVSVAGSKYAFGEKVDWGATALDVGLQLFIGKFGGKAVQGIGGAVSSRLAGNLAADNIARLGIEKVVNSVVLQEGSVVLQTTTQAVYAKLRGKDITKEQFFDALVDELTDPKGIAIAAVLGAVDAKMGALSAGPRGDGMAHKGADKPHEEHSPSHAETPPGEPKQSEASSTQAKQSPPPGGVGAMLAQAQAIAAQVAAAQAGTHPVEVKEPSTGGGGGATEPPTGDSGGSPSRPPAQTIKASPPPPPQQTSRPDAPTPVTDVEVVKTNVNAPASIRVQAPGPHQTDWTARGGTGKAPAAYRDSEGNVHVSTDHPLMGDGTKPGGIPPARPGGAPPPVRTPSPVQPAPSSTPTTSGGDIGLEDTGRAPAQPAVGPAPPPGPNGTAHTQPPPQPPSRRIDPPQAVSREVVENIRNRPRAVDPRRKGSGSNVSYTTDHEAHELAWQRLGGHGDSPPAFIFDNQVYLDPSRWKD